MSDEAQDEAPSGGGGAAGGSTLKKYGPLAAIVLLAQVVLAWVVIQVTLKDNVGTRETAEELLPEVEEQMEGEEGTQSTELPFYLKRPAMLDGITANPAGTNAQRFVVVGIELGLIGHDADGEPFKPKDIETNAEALLKVDANLGKMKAIIINVLGSKYIDQYEKQMAEIADEIRRELNRQVFEKIPWDDDGKMGIEVAEVIFTGKIIQ